MLRLIKATLQATHSQPIIDLALNSDDPKIKPLAFPHLAPMRLLQTFLDFPKEENLRITKSKVWTEDGVFNSIGFRTKRFVSIGDMHLRDGSMKYLKGIAKERGIEINQSWMVSETIGQGSFYMSKSTWAQIIGVSTPIHETGSSVREAVVLNP